MLYRENTCILYSIRTVFDHPAVISFFCLFALLQPTCDTMNARESFFSLIESDTLVAQLSSNQCIFAPVIHLLISKLSFGNSIGISFGFESSTLYTTSGDLSSIKSILEKCEGLRFTNVSIEFKNSGEYADAQSLMNFGRLTKLFASYMDSQSTSSLTIYNHNISCISVIDKNFLKRITELSICAPPREEISYRKDMSVLRDVDLNLRVLTYYGDKLIYIEDIWEIVGATLEERRMDS